MTLDLNLYSAKILDNDDKPLFEEAVKTAAIGALRSSYVMIWISCAESLKRRFREAQQRDGSARRIVGEIKQKEEQHRSVDGYVLDKAKEHGFITDSAHQILRHIYEMRCVYGHPYEEDPTEEQVTHAASSIVEYLLSKPVALSHGFASDLLNKMTTDTSYIDDYQPAVVAFAEEILPRISESIYEWLLKKYWEKVEPLASDPTMGIFFRRAMWFSQRMLVLYEDTIEESQWHHLVSTYPLISINVFSQSDLFSTIPALAQDYVVGKVFERSQVSPSNLNILGHLVAADVLTDRQVRRLNDYISENSNCSSDGAMWLKSSDLSLLLCFDHVIALLKSRNWHIQNPAANIVRNQGPTVIASLPSDQQIELGRNILQSADGRAHDSCLLMKDLSNGVPELWPIDFVRGVLLECFINESLEIRLKERCLGEAILATGCYDHETQALIIDQLVNDLSNGVLNPDEDDHSFRKVLRELDKHDFALSLRDKVDEIKATIPE